MSDQETRSKDQPLNCSEGCDERPHKHVWEFEPHYNTDFDVLCCDNQADAWDELMRVVESVYDNMEPGEERTITIRFNGVKS